LRPSGPISNKYDEHTVFQECLSTLESYKREREETLRRNLEKAQSAARCEHEFLSGERCRAPRVRDKKLCRMHEGMEEAKAVKLDLGPMEDADSIRWESGNCKRRLSMEGWTQSRLGICIHDPVGGMERNEETTAQAEAK